MPLRFPASLLAPLLAATLVGCGNAAQKKAGQTAQEAAQARQAVQKRYDAQTVQATLRRQGDTSRLEVVLVNPGGREATNRQSARAVGNTAQKAYGGTLDTVRVSFEYSSKSGPAEVGFHRRYTFSPSELEGAADTTTAPADTLNGNADTSSTPRP